MRDTDDSPLRVLILNGDLPVFPGRAGHEYLHTTRLARHTQKVGLVSLVHTREQDAKKQCLASAGVNLYLWQSPHLGESHSDNASRTNRARQIAKSIYYLVRSWPHRPTDTIVQDLQFRNMSGPILEALSSERWQALVVIQSNCAHWIDYVPHAAVSVVVLHDVRALVCERQARAGRSLFKRVACLLEAWRYRQWERHYCAEYDLVVTLSQSDEAWVRKYYRPKRVATVPIPVEGEYFAPMPGVRTAASRILFTGMMDHPPNIDAACFFARQVLPPVQAAVPEAEFWVVGRDPAPEVRALASVPGVVVTGFVSDIRPYIAQATVIVVPLRFGSGMRNKILEAWAMQKCVVSTRIGAEGLSYEDEVNILIADDAQTIADRVVQVIRDGNLRERIQAEGRSLIMRDHHPDKLAAQYCRAIGSVLREKGQRGDPMRVVVDLRWMRPGEAGGIENLSRSFLSQLLRLDRFNRYTVLLPQETKYEFDLRAHENVRLVGADGPGPYAKRLWWFGLKFVHSLLNADYWRSSEVETLRFAHNVDGEVVLSLSGYIKTDMYVYPNVLVVHDLQHEYYPEFFSRQVVEERRRVFGDSIRRASYLIAVSEYTRQTVLERFNVDPCRVATVYEAADPFFEPGNRRLIKKERVLQKYGLPDRQYLFFPGHTWPHKNHRAALQALRIVQETYGLDPVLVFTGKPKEAHSEILSLIEKLGLGRRVRFLGYCPVSDMPALYEGAAALVFPSFYEGFGIPLVEAMWCDCPVVCSNATSLPEIAGDAALLVDPCSAEELAGAVGRVLTDSALRQTLIERGRQQVRKFSWSKFTCEVVRIVARVRDERYG